MAVGRMRCNFCEKVINATDIFVKVDIIYSIEAVELFRRRTCREKHRMVRWITLTMLHVPVDEERENTESLVPLLPLMHKDVKNRPNTLPNILFSLNIKAKRALMTNQRYKLLSAGLIPRQYNVAGPR